MVVKFSIAIYLQLLQYNDSYCINPAELSICTINTGAKINSNISAFKIKKARLVEVMSSPRSEATSISDVSIISQWQDILGIPAEISQRLSGDEEFRVVVQHLNDYIATNNASIEEYEQALREFTATVEEKNRTLRM